MKLKDVISVADMERCGERTLPVLSMTMHDGIVLQADRFKKAIASKDLSSYKVVRRNQLVVSFPIDEGVLYIQDLVDAGIVSPAYAIWDIHANMVYPRYLGMFLRSPRSIQYYKSKLRGSTARRRTIPRDDFLCMELPDVSIAEQRKICTTLDKIKIVISECEQQINRLGEIVKSRFVEMFGDPMTNPKGWLTGRVSDLAKYWNGLTYKPENVSDTGTIVLRSSNIQGGSLDFADIVRVNISAKEKNLVAPGDVLMCSRNGSAALVGKTAIIPKTDERMYFGAFMMILRSEVPEYLNAFFATKAFRSQIACGATSTVNQITCTMMDNVSLPIPPKDLMREFAAFVEKVDKLAFAARRRRDVAKQLYRAKIQEFFG